MKAVYIKVLKNQRNIYLQMKQVISPLHCGPPFKLILKAQIAAHRIREQAWAASSLLQQCPLLDPVAYMALTKQLLRRTLMKAVLHGMTYTLMGFCLGVT